MNPTKRVCRLVALVGLAAAAVAGPIHADVILDLGRGPMTIHVPPSYDPSHPAPLVMALHGYSGTGQGMEDYVELLPWSDRIGFLYVYPDGTVDQDGYRFWNATDACCDFYGTGVDDSSYLRSLIDAIIAELTVDTERIFILGHSNGAFMAYRMACDHADIIAAVASLAGATFADPADCTPPAPVRTLQIHGTADAVIFYEGGTIFDVPYPGAVATTEQWASYNQCSTVPDLTQPPLDLDRLLPGFETTVARYAAGCAPGGSAELWSIVDGGHDPSLSRDFAPLVLNFFLSDGEENALLIYRQFIPAAAYAAGAQGAFFQTDVDVSNADDQTVEYEFSWLPRGEDNSEPMTSEIFNLEAGMSARYANVLGEVFGLEPDALGALLIKSTSPDLLAMSRTYNTPSGDAAGTYGQSMPAITPDDMTHVGERRRILFATENADMRTNIGCQNGTDGRLFINLEMFDMEGTSLGTEMLMLQPWGNDQLNRIFEDYAPVSGYAEVWTILPTGEFYCYGSVLDNVTSDPTTVLPQ